MNPKRSRLEPDQLAGIEEKLERRRDILNLGVEINAFIKSSPDAGVANPRQTERSNGSMPTRIVSFSEIRRACRRDRSPLAFLPRSHRVGLPSDDYRRDNETAIAFPIYLAPRTKDSTPLRPIHKDHQPRRAQTHR